MKFAKYLTCLFLVFALVFIVVPKDVGAAVSAPAAVGNPGETVTVDFSYDMIVGINGNFIFSNPDIISAISITATGMSGAFNPDQYYVAYFSAMKTDTVISVHLTIAEDAPVGSSTKVTFKYEATEDGYLPPEPDYKYDEVTLTVTAPKVIDYSELEAQIKRAGFLNKDEYTQASWDAMIAILEDAKKAQSSTDQETVDRIASELRKSIDSLVRVTPSIDYSELQTQISRAEGLNASDYTSDSWARVQTALNTAKSALNSTDQAVVDNAAKNLKFAIDTLVSAGSLVDYSELQTQIRRAESLHQNDYTADSWSKMSTALAEAKKALTSTDQWAVDAASANLRQAIDRLVPAVSSNGVDYSVLKNYIAQAEALDESEYTENSWDVLEDALANAKRFLDSESQDDVDAAAYKLSSAIWALVKKGADERIDYSELNKLIAETEALNPKDYSKTSWKAVNDALYNAVQARESTDQLVVDEAANALKEALDGLAKIDYTPLIEALKKVENLNLSYGGLEDLFSQLSSYIIEAELLLDGGEQADINRCAANIIEVLGKISAELQKIGVDNGGVKDETPAAPVVKEESSNIWLILFIISLSVNIIGIAAVVVLMILKKKKTGDDVPLVNYNIEDDAE